MLKMLSISKISYSKRVAIAVGLFHCFRLLTGAISAIFFLRSGVTISELAILQMAFSSTMLIVSYPIGIVCDIYGGKYFAYIACLIISFFYFLCTLSPNINILIFAHFLNAIGLAFIGCASSVWVVALIKDEKPPTKNYINYLGHLCGEIESIGGVVSGILGVMLVYKFEGNGYVYVFHITSVLMFILSFIILSIPEARGSKSKRKVTELFKLNLDQVFGRKEVIIFILISSLIVILYQPIYHFWQPYFVEFAFTKNSNENIILGLCFALFSLAKYVFNSYVKAMLIKNDNIDLIKIAIIITSALIPLFYCVAINKQSFLLACTLFCLLHGCLSLISRIIGGQYLKTASENSTASIMAVSEIFGRVLTILYFMFLYKILKYIDVREIFYISIIVSSMIVIGLIFWRSKINQNTEKLIYSA